MGSLLLHLLIFGRNLPSEVLEIVGHGILAHLPQDPSSVVIVVKSDIPSPVRPKPIGRRQSSGGPDYDPSVVFLLELVTILTMRDETTISALGQDVAEVLQRFVRDPSQVHSLIVSRSVFYLLNLLNASNVSSRFIIQNRPLTSCRTIRFSVLLSFSTLSRAWTNPRYKHQRYLL